MRFVSGGDRCSSLRTYYGDAKLGSICVSSDQLLQGHSFGTGTQLGRMRFLRTILRGVHQTSWFKATLTSNDFFSNREQILGYT